MVTEIQNIATGKRKTSIARIRLIPGTGQILINERPLESYFPRDTDRMLIKQPFEAASIAGKYDAYVNVYGGGTSGQAGAIRHGIARALVSVNPSFREHLRKAGLLTRDSRVKERKKYGQRGARRRFQYSKR